MPCALWASGLDSLSFVPGGLAQLGERLHGMQEVMGSSPISSTITHFKQTVYRPIASFTPARGTCVLSGRYHSLRDGNLPSYLRLPRSRFSAQGPAGWHVLQVQIIVGTIDS